ncbi:MAG: NfeD family protein, partial [Anaerolineaceae bacterium]
IMTIAVRAQRRPILFGRETLPGKHGLVEQDLNPRGLVRVDGELWTAELAHGGALPRGARIEVVSVSGLVLQVRASADGNSL